jgi:membrane protein
MATRAKREKTGGKRRLTPSRSVAERPGAGARDANGKDADSPLEMPAEGWRQVVIRAWKRGWRDNIGLVAAGTAFYGFISIVPVLIVAAILYSLVADPEEVVRNAARLDAILPGGAVDAVSAQLERVVSASVRARGLGFLGAVIVAIFGARNAATAIIAALNIAYDEEEKRGFAKLSLVALTIMGAGFGLALSLLILLSYLGTVRSSLPDLGSAQWIALRVSVLILGVALGAAGAAALYRFAPCRSKAKWRWVTPGSMFAAISWLALTSGFSFYVTQSGTFATNYGPAAAAVVILVWLYLSAVLFLFGGEINAELERQTAQDTTEGHDKPIGQRGAEAADEVAGV